MRSCLKFRSPDLLLPKGTARADPGPDQAQAAIMRAGIGMATAAQTVIAVSTILGRPRAPAVAEALARDAERIRRAIFALHG